MVSQLAANFCLMSDQKQWMKLGAYRHAVRKRGRIVAQRWLAPGDTVEVGGLGMARTAFE